MQPHEICISFNFYIMAFFSEFKQKSSVNRHYFIYLRHKSVPKLLDQDADTAKLQEFKKVGGTAL